jgi:DGQHR domain-containing protein
MDMRDKFIALQAKQGEDHAVFCFAATAQEVLRLARIDRAGRNDQGDLFGFQRPQIAQHIHQIRDYLKRPDAVLPNSVVIALTDGVSASPHSAGGVELAFDLSKGPVATVVDGQQRLSALEPLKERSFEVFVSCLVCKDIKELQRQFILINSTRPLPKELIYELLPNVEGLAPSLSARSFASAVVQRLNFDPASPLRGQVHLHTNPNGRISSNALQKVVINSRSDGSMREVFTSAGEQGAFELVSDFYGAVMDVFGGAWVGMSPKTSRLVHGVGIVALGYVMDYGWIAEGARTRSAFAAILKRLEGHTAWASGAWDFPGDRRPWIRLQNTGTDIRLLTDYLLATLKRSRRVSHPVQLAEAAYD